MIKQKWFHAIGICGKTTANVVLMFKKQGWFVTGSDTQFFPPVSIQLNTEEVPTVEGYNYKHLTKEFWEERLGKKLDIGDNPDLGLIIDTATIKNKEYLFAQKKGIVFTTYASILGEYLVKEESIVIIGTAGKTTTTTLIVFLMQALALDPSYMIGGETLDIKESLKNTESNFSVLEGDEYHNIQLSSGAKFLQYKPKYLIITKIDWEHQDIFSTQEKYIEEFAKAVRIIPEDGFIIVKDGDENIDKAIKDAKCKIIRYGSRKSLINKIWRVEKGIYGVNKIYNEKDQFILEFKTNLLGDYNLENILAAVTLILNLPARTLPIDIVSKGLTNLGIIANKIESFHGIKKRLEILYKSEEVIIIDDFGVTPNRADNSIKTLKEYFPSFKIIAIFEPNSASRQKEYTMFNTMYSKSFQQVDELYIPSLSEIDSNLLTANELVDKLKEFNIKTKQINSDNLNEELTKKIKMMLTNKEKILLVFFSSYRLTKIAYLLRDYFIN